MLTLLIRKQILSALAVPKHSAVANATQHEDAAVGINNYLSKMPWRCDPLRFVLNNRVLVISQWETN